MKEEKKKKGGRKTTSHEFRKKTNFVWGKKKGGTKLASSRELLDKAEKE